VLDYQGLHQRTVKDGGGLVRSRKPIWKVIKRAYCDTSARHSCVTEGE
jgi:hypothetical protein